MGSTLEHGIYLPSEGEKNCYQGLASNWNKVDGALGDVAGLKQLIESKFTKEIVTELPTEDINPYCIYMILKTDPETNNIYDEWVYINNAWEYLGNTQVDMTQYYTKQEVNELPAVASGVTSTKVGNYDTHLADSNIHVTSADKSKWDTVALIKQLRLVNAQVGSATTIAFANIDDTNGIKVGDKCMDLDAKMFEITAVDTTNQTVTVGSALIDLALDANVVHTSGNETVGGQKTFSSDITLQGTTTPVIKTISNIVQDTSAYNGSVSWVIRDKDNLNNILESALYKYSSKSIDWQLKLTGIDNGVSNTKGIRFILDPVNNVANFISIGNNTISLGNSSTKWKSVYATEYYYGSNNIEFSTKFVTTDTNQTISGAKTFSDNLTIYNSDDTQTPKGLTIRNAQWGMGESGGTTVSNINFLDKNSSIPASVMASKGFSGQSFLRFGVRTKDSQNNTYSEEIYYDIDTSGNVEFRSWHDDVTSLGTSAYRWKDCQTKLINGLTPSSLGMPSGTIADQVDISSYFTNTGSGDTNSYTALANGWIYLHVTACKTLTAYIQTATDTLYADYRERSSDGQIRIMLPIQKNNKFTSHWTTSTNVSITKAVFIPCQGNI